MIICICGNGQPKHRVNKVYYLPGDIRRNDIKQIDEALKSIRTFMQQLMENMQPVLENMAKELREIAKVSPFKEYIEKLEMEYVPREPLPRPLKIIKAVNLNRRVNKIIYYHIRVLASSNIWCRKKGLDENRS